MTNEGASERITGKTDFLSDDEFSQLPPGIETTKEDDDEVGLRMLRGRLLLDFVGAKGAAEVADDHMRSSCNAERPVAAKKSRRVGAHGRFR